jgi:alpha-tubulin suppressor-like RCC1 family protein
MKMRFLSIALAATVASAFAFQASCGSTAPPPGQLMIVVQSDMSFPKDVDHVGVQILSGGRIQHSEVYEIGPDALLLPASLSLIVGKDPATPVTIRVFAQQGGRVRVLRETITTVPADRIAMLRMKIQWISDGSATTTGSPIDPSNPLVIATTCNPGETSVAGVCVSATVDESTLPTLSNDELFGAPTLEEAVAFDTVACFEGAAVATVDESSCMIDAPPGAHDTVNVGLRPLDTKDGFCGPSGCVVPLDRVEPSPSSPLSGWVDGARLKLPPGVCDQRKKGRRFDVVVSTVCLTKTEKISPCGPSSRVTNCGIKPIKAPPPGDAGDAGPAPPPAVALALGANHSCALRQDGVVFCWGANNLGQLGVPSTTFDSATPVRMPSLPGSALAISAGAGYSCALVPPNVMCWGDLTNLVPNGAGRQRPYEPTVVATPPGGNVISIEASRTSANDRDCFAGAGAGGTIQCWGSSANRALGPNGPQDGGVATSPPPVLQASVANGTGHLALGASFTCASTSDATVQCWGLNDRGQLGRGGVTPANDPLPVVVPLLPTASPQLAAGTKFVCSVTTVGDVYCWGDNGFFQVANDLGALNATPTKIDLGVTAPAKLVSAGFDFACAALEDPTIGGVRCWGKNDFGQLGATPSSPSSVAKIALVSPGATIKALSSGGKHTCAIVNDVIKCWGSNANGQLGAADFLTQVVTTVPPLR